MLGEACTFTSLNEILGSLHIKSFGSWTTQYSHFKQVL